MATVLHDSDCAKHNMPAYPNGPCDCGADAIIAAIDGAGKSSDVSGYFHPGIIPVETKGMWKLEQRAYILHSLALGGLTAWKNKDRRCRAQNLWRKFQQRYPQFAPAKGKQP